eukprot:COSAG02_NODE_17629_length_990_cov_1.235690_2_plen_144_part_00
MWLQLQTLSRECMARECLEPTCQTWISYPLRALIGLDWIGSSTTISTTQSLHMPSNQQHTCRRSHSYAPSTLATSQLNQGGRSHSQASPLTMIVCVPLEVDRAAARAAQRQTLQHSKGDYEQLPQPHAVKGQWYLDSCNYTCQ